MTSTIYGDKAYQCKMELLRIQINHVKCQNKYSKLTREMVFGNLTEEESKRKDQKLKELMVEMKGLTRQIDVLEEKYFD